MPRPTRGRRICVRPAYERFTPAGFPGGEAVTLLVEEYECIRSIDHDGLKQEECAKRMAISRTTVAEIYAAARKKIAESLVHGRPLIIEGGFYRLCDMSAPCGKCCPRAEARQDYRFSPPRKKGEGTMRIAVPYENENGTVFQHFGHSQAFKLYDVKEDAVEKSEVVSTQGSGHGALAGFLKENEVDALICGGIGAQDEHPRLRLAAVLVEILRDDAAIGGLADDFAEVAAWCGLGDFLVVGIVVKGLHLARDVGDASSLCCRAVGVQQRLRQGVVHAQRHVDAAYRHHPHALRVAARTVE